MKFIIALILFIFQISSSDLTAQPLSIKMLDEGKISSLRGISIVNDKVIWVCGSNGWVAHTIDGAHFTWMRVTGYEKIDFRSIHAFSDKIAVIVSVGSPAYIFKTENGGISWSKVYEDTHPAAFYDGIDFITKNTGFIYGDPIEGKMQLLKTTDAGQSWRNVTNDFNIQLAKDEASFAASGTGIEAYRGQIYILTGGSKSRLFILDPHKLTHKAANIPITQGNPSQGAFSLSIMRKHAYIVGGDYQNQTDIKNNLAIYHLNKSIWKSVSPNVFGYRCGIEAKNPRIIMTTGDQGISYSKDYGTSWTSITTQGYFGIKITPNKKIFYLIGNNGKIGIIKP